MNNIIVILGLNAYSRRVEDEHITLESKDPKESSTNILTPENNHYVAVPSDDCLNKVSSNQNAGVEIIFDRDVGNKEDEEENVDQENNQN